MVNSILNAITKQMGDRFGSDYAYYVENVEQNLRTPCFTIDMLNPTLRSRSPVIYDRTMPVVIHYFGDNDKTTNKKKGYAIAEEVVECLEYLNFKDTKLRAESINWHFVEDVLEIFVTYELMTTKVVEETIIEEMDYSVSSNN